MFSNLEVFLRLAVKQRVNSETLRQIDNGIQQKTYRISAKTERRQERTIFICEMLFSNP